MSEVKVNKISPKQTCTTVTLGDSGDDFVVATGVNFKTAAVKDAAGNVIVSRCGSNITIGSSGAAIALACGATQTGFGRTGTVDWDTTAKTASFTAVSGNGYFVNTTSGAITVTLPATPSAGDIVAVKDYANTFDTNNLVIDRNGSVIDGVANNFTVSTEGQSLTLVYVDGTRGWVPTDAAKASDFAQQALFVTATGGTITTCGNFKIHTFTSPGTFCVSCAGNLIGSDKVDYLVIAGGGGGDQGGGAYGGAGGGAGGFRTTFPSPGCNAGAFPITASAFPITVGAGGTANGTRGSDSIFSTITSAGGGAQGCGGTAPGGSGSGGGLTITFGTGNTPPVSPPQGNPGGPSFGLAGSGGGGAGATGGCAEASQNGGAGGAGSANSITGSSVTRAGGGGAGSSTWNCGSVPKPGGCGGAGGGGTGGTAFNTNPAPSGINGTAGNANSGGGGGGGAWCSGGPLGPSPLNQAGTGGNGGSGIVIIRYKYQ